MDGLPEVHEEELQQLHQLASPFPDHPLHSDAPELPCLSPVPVGAYLLVYDALDAEVADKQNLHGHQDEDQKVAGGCILLPQSSSQCLAY